MIRDAERTRWQSAAGRAGKPHYFRVLLSHRSVRSSRLCRSSCGTKAAIAKNSFQSGKKAQKPSRFFYTQQSVTPVSWNRPLWPPRELRLTRGLAFRLARCVRAEAAFDSAGWFRAHAPVSLLLGLLVPAPFARGVRRPRCSSALDNNQLAEEEAKRARLLPRVAGRDRFRAFLGCVSSEVTVVPKCVPPGGASSSSFRELSVECLSSEAVWV